MRKIYVVAALLLLFLVQSFGQITLVKTLDTSSSDLCKFTNSDGSNGFIVDNKSSGLTVFNEDFSFNRTVKLTIPNFSRINRISRYNGIDYEGIMGSSHLFNDDVALEFIVELYDKTTKQIGFSIVDENNNTIFSKYADVIYNAIDFELETTSVKMYLLVKYVNYNDFSQPTKTEIYSLPGTERFDWCSSSSNTSDVKSVISKSKVLAFPNPSKTTVNLSYSLPDNSKGTLSVYDLSGKCLKTMKVDGAFPYVTLDVTDYASATYIYKVESNGTSVSEKFIVSK